MRLAALILSTCMLSGCTLAPTADACSSDPIRLSSIELPLRVASLALGGAEVVAALGAEASLVGQDLGSDLDLPVLNPRHEVDLEGLLALSPDLTLIDQTEPDERVFEVLDQSGGQTLRLDPPNSLQESFDQIADIANALGVPERGDALVQLIQEQLEQVDKDRFKGKSIAFLYLRGNAGVYLLGGDGSGADDLIEILGATDIGTELGIKGFAPISSEVLRRENPDYVLVMSKGLESVGGTEGLIAMPGVMGTHAALNRSILTAEDSALLSFGPRTPAVLRCLVEQG